MSVGLSVPRKAGTLLYGRIIEAIGRAGGAAIGSAVEGRRADTSGTLHGLSVIVTVGALVGDGFNELASGAHAVDSIVDLSTWTVLWDTLVALVIVTIIADTLTE